MSFDPVAFNETTRQQWETAVVAWHRWGSTRRLVLSGAR